MIGSSLAAVAWREETGQEEHIFSYLANRSRRKPKENNSLPPGRARPDRRRAPEGGKRATSTYHVIFGFMIGYSTVQYVSSYLVINEVHHLTIHEKEAAEKYGLRHRE